MSARSGASKSAATPMSSSPRHYDVGAIDIGASIACSGVCLTVVDKGSGEDRWFAVTASGETLSQDDDRRLESRADPVNLERPLRVGDELGGHIVTGHVDGVAEVDARDARRRIAAADLRGADGRCCASSRPKARSRSMACR